MRRISGIAVAALLAVAGCSGSTGSEPPRSPAAEIARFSVAEGKRTAGPEEVAVRTGENVTLEVTSDQADELHVHGYDRTVPLAPGAPATIGFIADLPGIFEVELHHSGVAVTKLFGRAIDYTVVSTGMIALVQIAGIVTGHVLAVTSAHDRSVGVLRANYVKVGQYPMLALMIGYTAAGIALVSGS